MKDFVPYNEALELKELGFDEPCFGFYTEEYKTLIKNFCKYPINLPTKPFLSPTFAQAFRWFREQKVLGLVNPIDDWHNWSFSILAEDCMSPFFEAFQGLEYSTYEKAELACLKKLIEIVKCDKSK